MGQVGGFATGYQPDLQFYTPEMLYDQLEDLDVWGIYGNYIFENDTNNLVQPIGVFLKVELVDFPAVT